MKVSIKQRFEHGTTGNRARVVRIMESGGRVYVDVEQTHDACERTVMVAINKALKDYDFDTKEGSHGEESEEGH